MRIWSVNAARRSVSDWILALEEARLEGTPASYSSRPHLPHAAAPSSHGSAFPTRQALRDAIKGGSMEAFKAHLAGGASRAYRDRQGNTPLHLARHPY